MPIADKSIQAALLAEIKELYEKRGNLEGKIRAVDALSMDRIETGALQDIAAYRSLQILSPKPV